MMHLRSESANRSPLRRWRWPRCDDDPSAAQPAFPGMVDGIVGGRGRRHLHGKLVRQPQVVGVQERQIFAARRAGAGIARLSGHAGVLLAHDAQPRGNGLRDAAVASVEPSSTTISSRRRVALLPDRGDRLAQQSGPVVGGNDHRHQRLRFHDA